MLKQLTSAALAAALSVGMSYAQSNSNVTIPVNKTSAADGKQMFANYCASCHNVDGKGHGPVASSLKMPPTDLTMLSKNNNGEFPTKHIVGVLQFGTEISSHGSAGMPIWGPVLGKMDQGNPQEKELRISNLIQFLKSIQVK